MLKRSTDVTVGLPSCLHSVLLVSKSASLIRRSRCFGAMPSASSVLLAIHVKRTDNVELKNPILSYIRETYSDREAEDAVDDLVAIQTLRNELVTSQAGSQLTAKDSYIKCATGQRFQGAAVCTCMHACTMLCPASCINLSS